MSYLYITENGAVLSVDGGYFTVSYKNGLLHKIPKETLESVAFFGNVPVTTPCVRELLKRGIGLSYFSKNGAYYGRLESTAHNNIARLKKQIFMSENKEFALDIAKNIVKAKIKNQLVVLRRYAKNTSKNIDNDIQNMLYALKHIEQTENHNELIGYEGTAAKSYFSALSDIIDTAFAFRGRNRRPPKDPFNSMISLGYTLLLYEIYGEIENRGLSPYAGFLHRDNERHPTLASDLMEEWRAVIVDSVVLSLIQGKEISTECFERDDETGGIFINKEGLNIFLKKYENKMRSLNKYINDMSMSYRRCLWNQVSSLVKAIEEENAEIYAPIIIR